VPAVGATLASQTVTCVRFGDRGDQIRQGFSVKIERPSLKVMLFDAFSSGEVALGQIRQGFSLKI